MKRLAIIIPALLSAVAAASAQTLPQPVAPNNTMICLSINSIAVINGVPVGQLKSCYSVQDSVLQTLLAAYAQQCTGTPDGNGNDQRCTPQQIAASIGAQVVAGVNGTVIQYLRQQASNAVQPPALTPAQ